jgi:hypothetical protein
VLQCQSAKDEQAHRLASSGITSARRVFNR